MTPADDDAPRYAPGLPLPARAFLPGHMPHPRDLPGHRDPVAPPGPWERLGESDLFRHGIDLYNRSFFWEAHEAWEALWNACPRESALRAAFQGLIQLAAARLKERLGFADGSRKLARSACEKLERAARERVPLPLDLEGLVSLVRGHFEGSPPGPAPALRLSGALGKGEGRG